MASGKYQAYAEDLMNYTLDGGSFAQPTAANVFIAWTTGAAPTSTTVATELTGTGYVSGGLAIGTGVAVPGDPTIIDNDSQIQWTNGGGTWTTITGGLVHYGGTTFPVNVNNCLYFIDSLSISVPASATLTIAAGDLDIREA